MDDFTIKMLNDLAHNASFLTKVMFLIVNNNLLKGAAIIAALWYLWFNEKSISSDSREKIIITLYGTIIAIAIGRSLANLLPFRDRPIFNVEFNFPYKIDSLSELHSWSSFPSDHAILFFSLATGIFLISKKVGMLSFVYVFFAICFPRIYLGLHYPTDILAGAVIGIFIMWAISELKIFRRLSTNTVTLSITFPGMFYACFFILGFQICTLFNESRYLITVIFSYIFL
jgi:undecaprenyl-diphosphatase